MWQNLIYASKLSPLGSLFESHIDYDSFFDCEAAIFPEKEISYYLHIKKFC